MKNITLEPGCRNMTVDRERRKNKKYTLRSQKNFIVFIDGNCYNREQNLFLTPRKIGIVKDSDEEDEKNSSRFYQTREDLGASLKTGEKTGWKEKAAEQMSNRL